MFAGNAKSDPKTHWEKVYAAKAPDERSWYRTHLKISLDLIERAHGGKSASIIDIGGGESTLADDLLTRGCGNLTVLDISQNAIDVTRKRLDVAAKRIHWLVADITTAHLPAVAYDVWHDRAVFHFLTTAPQRVAYVRQVTRAVKSGGHVIIGTFGPEGPAKCSGLDVIRYDADSLRDQLGDRFRLEESLTELHRTPTGATQQFLYCCFQFE